MTCWSMNIGTERGGPSEKTGAMSPPLCHQQHPLDGKEQVMIQELFDETRTATFTTRWQPSTVPSSSQPSIVSQTVARSEEAHRHGRYCKVCTIDAGPYLRGGRVGTNLQSRSAVIECSTRVDAVMPLYCPAQPSVYCLASRQQWSPMSLTIQRLSQPLTSCG